MSIFATLYLAPGPGDEALRVLEADANNRGPESLLLARVAAVRKPNFLLEDYGIDPATCVYFELDKQRSGEARSKLAKLVRDLLQNTDVDVLLLYIDRAVVRRIGVLREIAAGYEEFVPRSHEWRTRESDLALDV